MKNKKSTGQIREEELKDIESSYYTGDLHEAYKFYIDRCQTAKEQRSQTYEEFDDLTYEQDYILNRRAANSYLRKKKNDDEVRIVSGLTEKKIEVVANELSSMNLKPEILAYDLDDNEISDLGRNMADIVKRTNEIEKDDDVWEEAIIELLTQRACFIEELYTDKEVMNKSREKGKLGVESLKFTKQPFRIQRAEKRVLDGRQVFLGDISIPAYLFNTQPYIVKYDRMLYEEAKLIYGDWKEWEKVKPGAKNAMEYGGSFKYRMGSIGEKEVEILHYMSYPDDEYQIIVNGVMMLEPGTALDWEHEGYNIGMFVLKTLGRNFAYGKPLTASAKTLQGLNDETIRLLIRKFRQGLEPPLAVNSSKIYSKDIWAPGAITQGLKAKEFERLIDHQGVTNSEMAMQDWIEKLTEEFIGASSIMQGLKETGSQTAREVLTLMKQGIKNLGRAVLAVMRMKRDATYLRIFNVLENYTNPIKKEKDAMTDKIMDVYRKFTIGDAAFENGKTGNKIIQFMDRGLNWGERQGIKEYTTRQEKRGNPLRIETINVKKLKEIYTVWYVVVNSQEKEGSELHKLMFQDALNIAVGVSQVAGTPLQGDNIIQDFGRTWNKRDWFRKQAPQGNQGNVASQANELLNKLGSSEMGAGLKPANVEKPSLNTAEGQAGI